MFQQTYYNCSLIRNRRAVFKNLTVLIKHVSLRLFWFWQHCKHVLTISVAVKGKVRFIYIFNLKSEKLQCKTAGAFYLKVIVFYK